MLADRLTTATLAGSRRGSLELLGSRGNWGYRLSVDADCFERSVGSHTFCEEWQTEPVVVGKLPFKIDIESDYIFRWSDVINDAFPVVGNVHLKVPRRSETILAQWKKISGGLVGFTTEGDYGLFEGYELINPAHVSLEKPRKAEILKMCFWLCKIRNDDTLIHTLAERWSDLCL